MTDTRTHAREEKGGVHPAAVGIKVNEDSLRQTFPPDVNIARSIVYHYLFAEAKAGRRLVEISQQKSDP